MTTLKLHGLIFSLSQYQIFFPYKSIILESSRLSPIYTKRFGLLSKLEIIKVNKIILYGHTKYKNPQTKLHHGNV